MPDPSSLPLALPNANVKSFSAIRRYIRSVNSTFTDQSVSLGDIPERPCLIKQTGHAQGHARPWHWACHVMRRRLGPTQSAFFSSALSGRVLLFLEVLRFQYLIVYCCCCVAVVYFISQQSAGIGNEAEANKERRTVTKFDMYSSVGTILYCSWKGASDYSSGYTARQMLWRSIWLNKYLYHINLGLNWSK